jgi:hypothetical protein
MLLLAGSTTPIRVLFPVVELPLQSPHSRLAVNFVGIFSRRCFGGDASFDGSDCPHFLSCSCENYAQYFPTLLSSPFQTYLPPAADSPAAIMHQSSRLLVEVWWPIEAVFYVCLKLHIQ